MKTKLSIMLQILVALTALFTLSTWPPHGASAQKNAPIDTFIAGPADSKVDTINIYADIERVGRKAELLKENTIRISQGSQKTQQEVNRLERDVRSINGRVRSDAQSEDWTDTTSKYFPEIKVAKRGTSQILIQAHSCTDCYNQHNFWYKLKHLFKK